MTLGGWLFMVVSVAFVWGLTFWCFRRVLSAPAEPAKQVKEFHSA
jgi:hypothetical protein